MLPERERVTTAAIARALVELAASPELLRDMVRRAANIIDGLGVWRVIGALECTPAKDGGRVALRAARQHDSDQLLEWQRDPSTRRYARNPAVPSEQEHQAWFQAQISKTSRIFEMVEHRGRPVGVVRLDEVKGHAAHYEVSIAIAPQSRGLGIGERSLAMIHRLVPHGTLLAEILPSNAASQASFRKAGFVFDRDNWLRKAPLSISV
jgi:RimJ/RimL family protein N-acetyltransferase